MIGFLENVNGDSIYQKTEITEVEDHLVIIFHVHLFLTSQLL